MYPHYHLHYDYHADFLHGFHHLMYVNKRIHVEARGSSIEAHEDDRIMRSVEH
jgi:hypothetical protein